MDTENRFSHVSIFQWGKRDVWHAANVRSKPTLDPADSSHKQRNGLFYREQKLIRLTF
jgi:hypothetical protein